MMLCMEFSIYDFGYDHGLLACMGGMVEMMSFLFYFHSTFTSFTIILIILQLLP